MGRIRFWVGIVVTVGWLGYMLYVIFNYKGIALKPNELGDLFAGFFAPLAFLWLILGYLQQGDELHLSTKALELQAKELNNSVQQQAALVAVTREQLEAEREKVKIEQIERDQRLKPVFSIHNTQNNHYSGLNNYRLRITNSGGSVTHVSASLLVPNQPSFPLLSGHTFANDSEFDGFFKLEYRIPSTGANVAVAYNDVLGRKGETNFSITYNNKGMLEFNPIETDLTQ